MIYIAFDQASNDSGFSVFKGDKNTLLDYGKFRTSSFDFIDKCLETEEFILDIISQYSEDNKIQIGIEDIQLQANVQTFKRLAQLQGTLLTTLKREFPGLETKIIHAASWKSFSGIKGKNRTEQKRNAQAMVKKEYSLEKVTQDEADAILLGRYLAGQERNWG